MKKYALYLAATVVCIQACEKDKDGDAPVNAIPYSLSAPACLVSNIKVNADGEVTNSVYQYDSQKRLSRISSSNDSDITSYEYAANTITEVETIKEIDGTTTTTKLTHILNAIGFIDKTIAKDSAQTLYTYDAQGYLVREIETSASGMSNYGTSYQYANGNRVTSYNLSFDWQTGAIKDSTLSSSYFYYDLPGKIEEWSTWCERLGRGSKNELKSTSGGFSTAAYEYTFGANNLPSSLNLTYIFGTATIGFIWKCN